MEIGEVVNDEKKKTRKKAEAEECPSCSCGTKKKKQQQQLPSLRQVLGLPKVIPDTAESGPDSPTSKEAGAALSPAIPYAGNATTNARITGALYPYHASHSNKSLPVDSGRSLHAVTSISYSPANLGPTAEPLQAYPAASTSTLNTYGYDDTAAAAQSQRYRPPSWLLKRQDGEPSSKAHRYRTHNFETEDDNRVFPASSSSSIPYPTLGASRYAMAGQVDREVDMNVDDEPESYEVEESTSYQGDQDADLGMDEQQHQQQQQYQEDYGDGDEEGERYRRYRRYRRGDGEVGGGGGRHAHPQKRNRTSKNGDDPGSLLPLLPLPVPLPHSHSHAHSHSSSHAYTAHRSPVVSVNSPVSSHQLSPTLSLPLSLPLPLSSSSSSGPTTAAPTPSLREDVPISPSAALPPLALALNPDIVQTAHLLASIAELGVRSPLSNPALSVTGSASRTTSSSKSSSSASRPTKAKKTAGTAALRAPAQPAVEKQSRSGSTGSKGKNSIAKRTASTSPRAPNDLNQSRHLEDGLPTISATASSPHQVPQVAETISSAAAAASLLSALAQPSYTSPANASKPAGFDDYLDHPRGSNSLNLPFDNNNHSMRHLQSPLVSSNTGTGTTDSNSSSYFAFSSPAASASTSSIPRHGGRGAMSGGEGMQGSHDTTPEDRHSTIMEEDEEDQDEDDEGDEEYDEPYSQNGGHPPAESVGSSSGAGGGAGSSSSTGRYACTVCNKYFSRPSALAVHSHMHTGEKPFTCTICHRSFSVNSNLKRHLKTHSKAPSRKML